MVRPATSGEGHTPDRRQRDDDEHRAFVGAVWSVPSYILSGMAVYGGVGWLLDRWLQTSGLFPAGLLVGLGLAFCLIYVRYGR